MRSRQLYTLTLLGVFLIISVYFIRNPTPDTIPASLKAARKGDQADNAHSKKATGGAGKEKGTTGRDSGDDRPPLAVENKQDLLGPQYSLPDAGTSITSAVHPIDKLVGKANDDLDQILKRQSKTLDEAVAEYKRRYKVHPPPNFDKWFEFAKTKNVKLIDEYDSIFDSLTPFWGLSPAALRERVKEALGFDNSLMGVTIRAGKVVKVDGAAEWQNKATGGMLKSFVKHLPDMDLAFNIHDEPRVVIAHDDLSRLIQRAKDQHMPAAFKEQNPQNKWTKATDIGDGKYFDEYRFTRFNIFAHQPTWTHSRASCPVSSPARSLDEETLDDTKHWRSEDGLFIQNKTAFSNICSSPSLKSSFGFFDRPNALSIVQDLFPIFSQSKVSSYQDILYPSPWYWNEQVPYSEAQDYAWTDKENHLYWRGSTTGGFSRNGGWRRQHRQQIVGNLNRNEEATILEPSGEGESAKWIVKKQPKHDFKELMDVHFSSVGQCDPGDCDAQKEYFELAEPAKQWDAWKYKYLLDMDGNAFSGRFYAFLQSHSTVFKMAIFREWHEEWIKPWVHYVPLSLSGGEYFEAIRYFDREPRGQELAVQVAESGRSWAKKALRNEDLEAFFFRLLLEYGRLLDDNRHAIGYAHHETGTGAT
jgi:hypothetical protein